VLFLFSKKINAECPPTIYRCKNGAFCFFISQLSIEFLQDAFNPVHFPDARVLKTYRQSQTIFLGNCLLRGLSTQDWLQAGWCAAIFIVAWILKLPTHYFVYLINFPVQIMDEPTPHQLACPFSGRCCSALGGSSKTRPEKPLLQVRKLANSDQFHSQREIR
jgi:hypothetical protein